MRESPAEPLEKVACVLLNKQEVRALIEKIGIVPVIRTASPQEARFAAEAVWQGGIPIVEITMHLNCEPGTLSLSVVACNTVLRR